MKNVLWMAPGLALAAAIYIFLNEVRYHTLLDHGLDYIPNIGDLTQNPRWGTRYLYTNIKTLLWWPPKFNSTWPYMHHHFLGAGLLFTSPAFLLVFRRK